MLKSMFKMKKTLAVLVLFAFSAPSFAQMSKREKDKLSNRLESSFPEPHKGEKASINKVNVGLTAGMSNPNGGLGSSPEYGVNIGYQPVFPFGLGLEFATTELDDLNIQQTSVLVRGTYNLAGDIPVLRHSFLGVTGGPVFIENNDTEWAIGPVIGFDIPLQKSASRYLTLGAQARYLLISDADDTFSAGLALKYWY